jgi:hypothetical protein
VDAEAVPAYAMTITLTDDVYVDEPWLSIRWNGAYQHVHSEWRAFATSAELRAALLKGIRAIKEHKAVAYVSDARKLKVIVQPDQAWIKETWMPPAIKAGLKRIAFVTSATGLGRLNIEDIVELVNDHGLQSHTFGSMEAARKWVSGAP